MGGVTSIEWTDRTFNPWIGCSKVSEGCRFCYAEAMDRRLPGPELTPHWGRGVPRRVMSDEYWQQPFAWEARAKREVRRFRVFCASMADVFDEEAPVGQLERLWRVIRETPRLEWQLLTKRPERIAASLPSDWGQHGMMGVWLGTSVESQEWVEKRVPVLLDVPAHVHFLSCEPLLGPLDISPFLREQVEDIRPIRGGVGLIRRPRVDWVIAGGESGPRARACDASWVRSLRDQCNEARVPFFFKQWGKLSNNPVSSDSTARENGGHAKGGCFLDGRAWREFPGQQHLVGVG